MNLISNEVIIKTNELSALEWVTLREEAGFPTLDIKTAKEAIKHSNILSIHMNNICIGMLRIIGDNTYSFYINDMIIAPHQQKKGFGTMLLDKALEFIQVKVGKESLFSVSLFSNCDTVDFYTKFHFKKSTEIPLKLHLLAGKRGSRKDVLHSLVGYQPS